MVAPGLYYAANGARIIVVRSIAAEQAWMMKRQQGIMSNPTRQAQFEQGSERGVRVAPSFGSEQSRNMGYGFERNMQR